MGSGPSSGERLARLVRAARVLGGFSTTAALAEAIDEPGLSDKSLRLFEQGKRRPDTHQLRLIARACGLKFEFFIRRHDESQFPDGFHSRVARLRRYRGWTHADLAVAVSKALKHLRPDLDQAVTEDDVIEWENRTVAPDDRTLAAICEVFDVGRYELAPDRGGDDRVEAELANALATLEELRDANAHLQSRMSKMLDLAQYASQQALRWELRQRIEAASGRAAGFEWAASALQRLHRLAEKGVQIDDVSSREIAAALYEANDQIRQAIEERDRARAEMLQAAGSGELGAAEARANIEGEPEARATEARRPGTSASPAPASRRRQRRRS